MFHYSSSIIRQEVEKDRFRLFASYASGRSATWTCDQRTKDTVCLNVWLREELTRLGLDDHGRRTQEGEFYRLARNEYDLFELAARIMNDAQTGNIDRDRKPHRRWG